MTRSYFTEDAKMATSPWPQWTYDECEKIHRMLWEKGYNVNMVSRVGCDRKYHDAWSCYRSDIPRIIEQLFRQRIAVEVQAEGHGMASINFVYDYSASHIMDVVNRFQKNNNKETKV